MTYVVSVAGCMAGAGLCGLWWVRQGTPGFPHRALRLVDRRSGAVGTSGRTPERLAVALLPVAIPALVAGLVTRWPVAAILAGAAGGFVPRLFGATASIAAASRTEAIATWSEMLRDSLASASGLGQAIAVSAPISPSAIRAEVSVLAARVDAGVPLGVALRQFSDQVNDPGADLVVAALILATEQRAQKLGDLLGALAASAREEVSVRLRVEAGRSQVRTSVRVVAGFSLGFAAFLLVVARGYLAPYGTAGGQAVLALVGTVYACGLALLLAMAKPRPMPRLALTGRDDG